MRYPTREYQADRASNEKQPPTRLTSPDPETTKPTGRSTAARPNDPRRFDNTAPISRLLRHDQPATVAHISLTDTGALFDCR